uniref:Calpastatin n=1 Tax=Knipowitschia caucasica TaxID=637954 RepID=A0AAV2M5J0_KNICA
MAYAAYWMFLHGGVVLDPHLPSRFRDFCSFAVSKYLKIISWFRGSPPRDEPGLRDVSVEEKSSSGSNMASKTTGSDVAASKTTATTSVKVDPVTTKLSTGPTKTSSSTTTTAAAAASAAAAKAQQKTTATTSVKVDPVTTKLSTGPTKTSSSTTTTATTTATAAAAASTSAAKAQQKIQVEVPPKAPETKQAPSTPQTSSSVPPLDPLDALGSLLPTEAPKRPDPKFTGPEVTENVTSEEGVRVGEREDTLPPRYRRQDMPPVPADSKPAEVPKPMSTADALDVLSMGFMDTPPEKSVETISTASTAAANFAPAPAKKSDPAAPPADKKAKMDIGNFSLSAAVPADKAPLDSKVLVSAPKATVESSKAQSAASPTIQVEVPPKAPETKQAPSTPQTSSSVPPLDPLDALGSLLPTEAPKRPDPKFTGPEVTENVTSEEGVRVGEREDTLPPRYRRQDMPPVPADSKPAEVPKPMSTADALDVLSMGFMDTPPEKSVETISTASTAAANFAPAPAKKSDPAAPPADKKAKMDIGNFSLSAAVPAKRLGE